MIRRTLRPEQRELIRFGRITQDFMGELRGLVEGADPETVSRRSNEDVVAFMTVFRIHGVVDEVAKRLAPAAALYERLRGLSSETGIEAPGAVVSALRAHEDYAPYMIKKRREIEGIFAGIEDEEIRDICVQEGLSIWLMETVGRGARSEGVPAREFAGHISSEIGLRGIREIGGTAIDAEELGLRREEREGPRRKVTWRDLDGYSDFLLGPDGGRLEDVVRMRLAGRDEVAILDRGAGRCRAFEMLVERLSGVRGVVEEDGIRKVLVEVDGRPKKLALYASSRVGYEHPDYVNYLVGNADELRLSGMDEVWEVYGASTYDKKRLLIEQAYGMLRDGESEARIHLRPDFMRVEKADGTPVALPEFFARLSETEGYRLSYTVRDGLDEDGTTRVAGERSVLSMRKTHQKLALPIRVHAIERGEFSDIPVYVYRIDERVWTP